MPRVLIVDDEADIREIARLALELHGLEVETAGSIAEALERAAVRPPDAILLDVMLPGTDGPTGLPMLRRLRGLEDIPIAFVTAKVMPAEVERLEKLGAATVIGKPFDPMSLGPTLDGLLRRREPAATAGLEGALEQLRADFLLRLPSRSRELCVAIAASHASGAVGEVRHLAHKLAGTAATHRLPSVATLCREIEALCDHDLTRDERAARLSTAAQILETAVVQASSTLPPARPSGGPRTSAPSVAPAPRVVVVDDDPSHLAWLEQGLRNLGFDVATLDAAALLESTLARLVPDAVVMDIVFAEGRDEGLRVARRLRSTGQLTCPVVFLSVRDDFEARLEAQRGGADGYAVKPVHIVELSDTLRRLIAATRAPADEVLVVDDDPDMLAYCRAILEADGARVHTLADPFEVLPFLARTVPHVLVLDLKMPRCDGFELAGVIRQRADLLHVPIVFLTSERSQESRLRAAELAGDDFLAKPVDAALLVASVRSRAQRARRIGALLSGLRDAERRFASIAESTSEAIVAADARGTIVSWNPAAHKLLGYSTLEALGRPVASLVPARHRAEHNAAFERVARGEAPRLVGQSLELTARAKDGTEVPVELSLSSFGPSHARGFAAILRDIRARKAAQLELVRARDEAERASRAKGAFLGSMSHELRTPLNAVLGMTEALAEGVYGALSEPQRTAAETAHRSGQHLLAMIDDVLDLSRIDAGRLVLAKEDVDVGQLADQVLGMIEPRARARGLTVERRLDTADRTVRADPRRLRQILLNLLEHAISTGPRDGVLGLSLSSPGPALEIEVRNGAPPVPDEELALLFVPFASRHEGGVRDGSATGLGLALVQKLVELHGGTLRARSAPGEGHRFTVGLPTVPSLRPAPRPERVASGDAPLVLLVEDSEPNIVLTRDFLRSSGYRVAVAKTGLEGVELATDPEVMLVLMDIQLPGIDGLEATRRIRATDRGRSLPIVALTAFAMHGDREACLAAGVTDYLSKPVALRDLLGVVRAYAGAPRPRQQG